MTCALYWKPVSKDSNKVGDMQLREILERKYGYPSVLDCTDIPYIQALSDADVPGADDIIEAIRLHEEIKIFKEC